MRTEGKPRRLLPLPLDDGMIVIEQGQSGEIRWGCDGVYPWVLKYSYGSDDSYSLEISRKHSSLFSDIEPDNMLSTIQQLMESGLCNGRMPLDFRLEASLHIRAL